MFQSLKTVLALASLTSAAAFYDNVISERQTTCATGLHLMIGGGCSIPCSEDVPSLLSTLISNITYAFPGTDQYYVPYNGDMHQAQNSTVYMVQAFNSYVQQCPQTPIVFIGYSLGGIITMNTLCGGVSPSYAPNVIAAITYGEETFRNGLSYDVGTCTQPAPNYPRNNTDQCAPYAAAIQDYCDATDPNCCKGGLDPNSHFTYPQFYDIKALNFIKSRYAALASTTSTSATASSTTVRSTSTSITTGTVTVSTTLSTAASTVVSTKATTATSVSTVSSVSTMSTAKTPYSNSTATGAQSGSAAASSSASASASVSTIPHYSIPAVTGSSIIPAPATTFPAIPNSGILVPSSVYASYLPTIVSSVASPTGAASTAGAVTAAGTGSGSGSSATGTASGSSVATSTKPAVTSYTGAASRQIVSGAVGLAAGLAAYILA